MRKLRNVGMIMLAGALAWPVAAQQPGSFVGVNPRDIKFQVVDVGAANKAVNLSNKIRPQSQQSTLNLSRVFHSFSMPSWPPKVASAPILSGPNPFQPKPIAGSNPFDKILKK